MKKFFAMWLGMLMPCIPSARACKCSLPTVQDALISSDLVFVGTVIGVQAVGTPADTLFNAQRAIVTFTISVSYKGRVRDNVVLYTAYGGSWCGGFRFEKGVDYLIYARYKSAKEWLTKSDSTRMGLPLRESEILTTDACWRTQQIATAQVKSDLRDLSILTKRD